MFNTHGCRAIQNRTRIGLALAGLLVAGVVVGASFAQSTPAPPQDKADDRPSVLITGANRGLGLEFARQFHAAGYRVVATARKPDAADTLKALGVRVEQLDVTDPASVAALAKTLANEPLDVLINNAGISGRNRSIASADFQSVERVLSVNTIGPMRVTQALLPNLRKGKRKLVVNISSGLGSIENNTRGGNYGYRESKAALNMFTRSLAAELRPDGFKCIVMSPGWVRTDMGGPAARLSPAESIGAMITVMDGLKPEDSGRFLNYTGKPVPW